MRRKYNWKALHRAVLESRDGNARWALRDLVIEITDRKLTDLELCEGLLIAQKVKTDGLYEYGYLDAVTDYLAAMRGKLAAKKHRRFRMMVHGVVYAMALFSAITAIWAFLTVFS